MGKGCVWAFAAAVVSSGIGCANAGTGSCDLLLAGGLFDTRKAGFDYKTARSFSSWFCDQNFSSRSEAQNFGSSMGIPIEGIPVEMGMDYSTDSWSESYQNFCGAVSNDERVQAKFREYISRVNNALADTFERCVNSQGLHAWIERTENLREFVFATRYVFQGNEKPPKIESFDPGANVTCSGGPEGMTITASTQRYRCTRNDDSAVSVIVRAEYNVLGGDSLTLREIRKYPPPKPRKPEAFLFRASDRTDEAGIEVGGGLPQYGGNVIHNGPSSGGYPDKYNMVEFELRTRRSGKYALYSEYAMHVSRPTHILANGKIVKKSGLAQTTSDPGEGGQRWCYETTVDLLSNKTNKIRLERNAAFPHIRGLMLVEVVNEEEPRRGCNLACPIVGGC